MYLSATYASKVTASRAAEAKLKELDKGVCSLELNCTGNPVLLAESILNLNGISKDVDGLWIVENCNHEISDSGYRTSITSKLGLSQE